MDVSNFVPLSVIWSTLLANEGQFKRLTYFCEFDHSETGVVWPFDQKYKDYEDIKVVESEFYDGHRVRIAATQWSRQSPKAKVFRVVKFDSAQPEADQLNAIPDDWVILTGLEGTNALDANTWMEAKKMKNKIQFTCTNREDFGAGYPFQLFCDQTAIYSMGIWNEGAGTLLDIFQVVVSSGKAKIKFDSTAQVVTVTITGAVDTEVNSITYKGETESHTTSGAETVTDIRDALLALVQANNTFTGSLTIAASSTDAITFTATNQGLPFELTTTGNSISQVTTTPNSTAKHYSRAGMKVYIKGLTTFSALDGYHTITGIPDDDIIEIDTTEADGDESPGAGTATADCGYTAPDVALASWLLGWEPGEVDPAHKPIKGVFPTTDSKETEIKSDLEAVRANWFYEDDEGNACFWNGLTFGNKYVDSVFSIGIWYPWYLQRLIHRFIANPTGKRRSMSDATFAAALNLMNLAGAEAQERQITGEFVKDLALWPQTGYPPNANPGDHYSNVVPKKSDFSAEERADRREAKGGLESYINGAGGVHAMSVYIYASEA